jgi:hypothetical protein
MLLCIPGSAQDERIFELLSSSRTGVNFKNTITENVHHNALTYENLYNGGGVAIGDVNNDGLDDIYFVSNMEHNKLYLNQGNFKFKDKICRCFWPSRMEDRRYDGGHQW